LNKAILVWNEYALLGYQPYIGDSYARWACILYVIFSFFYNIFLLLMMLLYGVECITHFWPWEITNLLTVYSIKFQVIALILFPLWRTTSSKWMMYKYPIR